MLIHTYIPTYIYIPDILKVSEGLFSSPKMVHIGI